MQIFIYYSNKKESIKFIDSFYNKVINISIGDYNLFNSIHSRIINIIYELECYYVPYL